MITSTIDPISMNDVTDLEHAPFVIEGQGDNALMIYFESEANKREYLDIPVHGSDNMEGLKSIYDEMADNPNTRLHQLMSELGHVVFYVRDLQASVRFYTEAVGLQEQGRIFNQRGALLSGGRTHHELLLLQVGDAPGPLQGKRIGLYHTGWKVGDDLDTLEQVRRRVQEAGFMVENMADHTISQSLYLRDPDGNEVELYVDNPQIDWRNDKSWMEQPVKRL